MPMDHLLNLSATWSALAGHDGHGTPTFGAATPFQCRLEPADYELKLGRDRQVKIDARIFFRESLALGPDSRITAAGVTYRVVKIEKFYRVDGQADHFEALLSEVK